MEKENAKLKWIIKETLWMARRYADGRSSYAPRAFNEAVHELDGMGLRDLYSGDPAYGGKRFADDGMFGVYDPEIKTFIKRPDFNFDQGSGE